MKYFRAKVYKVVDAIQWTGENLVELINERIPVDSVSDEGVVFLKPILDKESGIDTFLMPWCVKKGQWLIGSHGRTEVMDDADFKRRFVEYSYRDKLPNYITDEA